MKDYTVMNDEIFYCRPWDDKNHKTDVNGYKIIVSDVIYGNVERSIIQVHIAVIKKNKIIIVSDADGRQTDNRSDCSIEDLQKNLRESMSCHLRWKEGALDRNTTKIWFYRPEDDPMNNKDNLYLRMAVTAINVNSVDESTEATIRNDLSRCMLQFVIQSLL